ncbi:hypothetical protein N656DRAFT_781707 [Canariomyces notabilis]|jgi:hypothetical protein|uniref:Uncharacterized protein n=1 Tax=Canariomyces notabilis TaxID=2074819 RepID=A0AAN6QHT3_9PEZI|nr:hypothetical protein N656DRAFT_781707 [Canariomyces arenarius]
MAIVPHDDQQPTPETASHSANLSEAKYMPCDLHSKPFAVFKDPTPELHSKVTPFPISQSSAGIH